jgi:hypothetical protein
MVALKQWQILQNNTGKLKKGTIHINSSLMPYKQAAIITQPSEGSFNFPTLSVTPKLSSIL